MKLPLKIAIINILVAFIFGWIFSTHGGSMGMQFGMMFLMAALIAVVIGLFLLIAKDKRYAQGFLMSGGLLLLLSIVTCGSSIGGL